VDKELADFDFITGYKLLIGHVESKIKKRVKNYLFIDEIQDIEQFEKALRHFQNKKTVDIYCTGSNANLLSGELASYLSGRSIEIKVNTLSYLEFLKFHDLDNTNESLKKYLKWGGLPFIKNLLKEDEIIFDYLRNIVSTIIYKDIVQRHKVRNVDFFENLIKYLANNTGNLFNAKKISDYLKSQKIAISTKVVLSYLHNLQNAFLVYKLKRENLAGKNIFATNNKYFFEDWGLRNALLGLNNFSVPSVLENVVFIHLINLGYEVNIGFVNEKEIDFVAKKDGENLYVQVAYLISDEKVKNREFGNLLLIKDNFPKYVVSMDEYKIGSDKGIKHIHLRDFLSIDKY
jgi:predicted AAA+ superfamily ATPase